MQEPLQPFGYQSSPYERPNQKWVCGKQAQGCPCEIGPDKNGRCRAGFECLPHNKDNQWFCTRSKAYGGACDEGPLPDGSCCRPVIPCQPTRSIRYKRKLAIIWLSLLTFSMLMLVVSSEAKRQFFSPGELTYQHAQIPDCDSCHAVFGKGFSAWIHQAINATSILDNNQQCLNCHEFDQHAAEAHSLSKKELMQVAHVMDSESESTRPGNKKIACMSCHVEHHGTHADLVAVDRQNCALCHDLPLRHAQQVHPDFRHYPYRRRTGIIFDHNQHYNKHFFDNSGENRLDEAPNSCVECHVSDTNGIKMLVRGYEKNCADCHNQIFEDSEPVTVISVPALNTGDIKGMGSWPSDSEAVLTPFMQLLLSGSKDNQELLANLKSDDLFDLEEEEAVAWAWSIKELFNDIDQNGRHAVASRLAKAYHCQLNAQGMLIQEPACYLTAKEWKRLVKSLSLPQICSAIQEWFPQLHTEVSMYQELEGKHHSELTDSKDNCRAILAKSGADEESDAWSLDYYNLQHRPDKHNDPFTRAWLDASRKHRNQTVDENLRKQVFTLLTSEETAGQCNYCHSIEKDKEVPGSFILNWSVAKWDQKRKDFIRFNHAGHLRNQEESVCKDCHQANKDSDYLASYQQYEPLQFQSNFVTEKAVCVSCHEQAMNKTQCQTCHNYHVTGAKFPDMFSSNSMVSGKLEMNTDKSVYKIGEPVTVKFSVSHPMYVRILRIDSSGKLLSLFPTDFRPDNLCKPNTVYQIPDVGSTRKLTIKPPAGTDWLIGIGSDYPIPEDSLYFTTDGKFDEKKMAFYTVRSVRELTVHE